MVEYQIVHPSFKPSFKLQLPDFKVERFYNQPKLDYTDVYNPEFGTRIMQDSLYDKLLQNLQNTSSQQQTSSIIPSNLNAAIQNHLGEIYNNAKRLKSGYSDCSGFVNKVYKDLGIDLGGATSITMFNNLTNHISFDQVQPGDLVFLTPKQSHNVAGTHRRAGIDASHVAIVVEKQGTRVKVAENTGHRKKSDFSWYELGGVNKPSGNGVINYSKGNRSKVKNELLGFGRINLSKVQNRNKR